MRQCGSMHDKLKVYGFPGSDLHRLWHITHTNQGVCSWWYVELD
jgi:hypothetical protein